MELQIKIKTTSSIKKLYGFYIYIKHNFLGYSIRVRQTCLLPSKEPFSLHKILLHLSNQTLQDTLNLPREKRNFPSARNCTYKRKARDEDNFPPEWSSINAIAFSPRKMETSDRISVIAKVVCNYLEPDRENHEVGYLTVNY